MALWKRLVAETMGTYWLVFAGCGSAVLATQLGLSIGPLGVSLAFGLTVLTMAYALGHISGGHFNPAVSLGLWVGRRFPGRDVLPYMIAQVVGATLAAGTLYLLAHHGTAGTAFASTTLGANGFGEHSPKGFGLGAALAGEALLTFVFLIIILGATSARAHAAAAPVAIGLGLTLIHLVGIPLTNLSVNPARSTGPALFVQGWALQQLWLFWAAPLLGAAAAGLVYTLVWEEKQK